MPYLFRFVLAPLVASIAVSAGATYLIRTAASRWGLLDKPGAHKQHEKATPTLGGVAVFLAFTAGVMLEGPLSQSSRLILLGSAVIVLVGLLDDLRGVSANIKLLMLATVSALLWSGGIHLNLMGVEGPASMLFTFLWLGLVSSAFNGVDNADGSAGGLACISSLATFCISWSTRQHELATISLVLAGAGFGFLFFNFPLPRASIFLGDSGSLFLGFGISTLTILGEWAHEGWKAAVVAICLVIAPLFDFIFILVVRGLEGRYKRWDDPIRYCARDHVFHRLRLLGWSPRQSLAGLYTLGGLGGLVAYRGVTHSDEVTVGSVIALMLALLGLACWLHRVKPPLEAYPRPS